MKRLIEDGRVHVFDGAMGTELYRRGVFLNVCYDELSLTRPSLVHQIHRAYVEAGAEILETNTFGANPVKLSSYGLGDRAEEINAAAARLSREAAGRDAVVLGAIGPLGVRVEPWGPTRAEEATRLYGRQVDGLLEGQVDGFVLETFSDLGEIACAYEAIRARTELPIVAQMTLGEDGKTAYGSDPVQIARELSAMGADVIGLNCSVGPAVMLDAVEEMADATDVPLSAQPNAGLPRTVRDRQIYLASPDYVAEYAGRMIDAGVRFVGGCCGTTPAHIRRIREVVDELEGVTPLSTRRSAPSSVSSALPADETAEPAPGDRPGPVDAVPLEQRSAWGSKLRHGHPVVCVEILPPHGWDVEHVVAPARALAAAGVDAVSLADAARQRIRMSALAAAAVVEREVGVETLVRYPCRGRNMLRILSDLLGAAAIGLRNLLAVSGAPSGLGPYPDAAEVLDIDAVGLTRVLRDLNRGVDPGGNLIGAPTRFVHGVTVSADGTGQDVELERLAAKLDAGAEFVVTRPLFGVAGLDPVLKLAARHGTPVIAGVWPLPSYRNAEFLANEVPEVSVPSPTVERMSRAGASGPEAELEEGLAIAHEVIEATRPLVQGIYLSAPRQDVSLALRVLREGGVVSA